MIYPLDFSGKNILVTGASSGFGRATSIALSELNANVVLSARNGSRLDESFALMKDGNHQIIPFDLSVIDGIHDFVSQLPLLDGAVMCAGILQTVPVQFVDFDSINKLFGTNAFAPFIMVKELLKQRKIKKGGAIVFVSSIATIKAANGNSIYAASKGAIDAFCKNLALECARMKIRCNIVQPGLVRTGISDMNVVTEDDLNKAEQKHPLGAGTVDDIANGIVFLLSDSSRWITGTSLVIDGGATL